LSLIGSSPGRASSQSAPYQPNDAIWTIQLPLRSKRA
jgi:hypothetical protein